MAHKSPNRRDRRVKKSLTPHQRELKRAKDQRYYSRHRERILKKLRAAYPKKKERARQSSRRYYATHRAQVCAQQATYRKKNRYFLAQSARLRYHKQRQRILKDRQEYRAQNRAYLRLQNRVADQRRDKEKRRLYKRHIYLNTLAQARLYITINRERYNANMRAWRLRQKDLAYGPAEANRI